MHYSSLPPTYTSNSECKRCTQIEASSVSLLNQAKCRHKLFKWQAPLRDLQAHNATNANPVRVLLCTDWGQVKWCSSFARLCFTHALSFLRENMNRQHINPPLHPSKSRREIQKKCNENIKTYLSRYRTTLVAVWQAIHLVKDVIPPILDAADCTHYFHTQH